MTAPVLADALGPRGRRRTRVASAVAGVLLLALLVVVVRRFSAEGELEGDLWSPLLDSGTLEFLGNGLLNTLKLAAAAMVMALALGGVLALGRLARNPPVRWIAGMHWGFALLGAVLSLVFLGLHPADKPLVVLPAVAVQLAWTAYVAARVRRAELAWRG